MTNAVEQNLSLEEQMKQQEQEQPAIVEKQQDEDVKEYFGVEGPKFPESAATNPAYNEKRLAKIIKMGGKRGVEIEGAADMGGLQFFCTNMEEGCDGDATLLMEACKAMNAKSDPSEEERKGGSGNIGKMIFSCTADKLAIIAYVPSNHSAAYKKDESTGAHALEWLKAAMTEVAGPAAVALDSFKIEGAEGVDAANYAVAQIEPTADEKSEKNLFPMKLRDPCITAAYSWLKKRGLFPEDDSEDEEEMCFGDDAFDEYC